MTSVGQEYEQAKANLWNAIVKRNPQLALFSSPAGTEGSIGRTAEPRKTGSPVAANHDTTSSPLRSPARDGSGRSCPAPEAAPGVVAAYQYEGDDRNSGRGVRGRPQKGA